jgi:hypothetical protein
MSDSIRFIRVFFDFSQIYPELDSEDMENATRQISKDIEDLVDSVSLVRESTLPEGAKSALGGFLLGVLKIESSEEGFKKLAGQNCFS